MPAAQINPSSSVLTAAVSIERERPDFPSDKKRRDALVLFNCGLGYSKVADILELNPNTVRDWAKSFLAGKFKTELSKTQFLKNNVTIEPTFFNEKSVLFNKENVCD